MDWLRRRLVDLSLKRRSRARAVTGWGIAVIGPVVVALALLPFRPSVGLASVLFCTLLVVVVAAALGGVAPAILAAVVGVLADEYLYTVPYDSFSIHRSVNRISVIVFVVAGVAVGIFVGILIDQLAELANEQAALRRVATLVAQTAAPEDVFAAVASEAGQLLGVDITNMHRYESGGAITVVANWERGGNRIPLGTSYELGGRNLSTLVAQTRAPVRMDSYDDMTGSLAAVAHEIGARSGVGTPIIVEGRLWGVMVAVSNRERPLPRDAERRLLTFTDLVATAIANAESRAELAASRARVVAAADEARRRIERDLHDGAQQRIVSLAMELRTAQTMVPEALPDLNAQLSLAVEGLNDVGEELHEISRGLHPAILSRGGIVPAMKMLARRSMVPVELEVNASQRLPEWLEAATFFVVSEALTNAAKHSGASLVRLSVQANDAVVELSVADDGVGGADPARGSGLIGLRDRVEAFGGTMEIVSAPGAGTSLRATIPTRPSATSTETVRRPDLRAP